MNAMNVGKSLTTLGGIGWNFIIHFVGKGLILPYFIFSAFQFSPTMAYANSNAKLKLWRSCFCNIVKGRKVNKGFQEIPTLSTAEKVGFIALQGIPSLHDVSRPLIAGIIIFRPFSTNCGLVHQGFGEKFSPTANAGYSAWISETLRKVFRLLLFMHVVFANEEPA
jgi:hypothetical protein